MGGSKFWRWVIGLAFLQGVGMFCWDFGRVEGFGAGGVGAVVICGFSVFRYDLPVLGVLKFLGGRGWFVVGSMDWSVSGLRGCGFEFFGFETGSF